MGGRTGKPRDASGSTPPPRPVQPTLRAACRRQLQRVRSICRELPESVEKLAWGAPTFRTPTRLFAMYACDHHRDGRVALWCRAPVGAQAGLVEAEPERFFVPPYVGPSGWVGLLLEKLGDAELAYFLREAWRLAAAPALRRRLETPDP